MAYVIVFPFVYLGPEKHSLLSAFSTHLFYYLSYSDVKNRKTKLKEWLKTQKLLNAVETTLMYLLK